MGKKKIIGLCLAVGLMVGVVGGSLAWFTDKDTVTNSFATQGSDNVDNNGIDIVENFDNSEDGPAKNVLPGSEIKKVVQVENKATYDQYIRVKLTKVWKDEKGNVIESIFVKGDKRVPAGTEGSEEVILNDKYIQLNLKDNIGEAADKWTDKSRDKSISGGYYYYNSIVEKNDGNDGEGTDITGKLLDSVTLSKEAGNPYKGLKFDVVVDAEGIQAENGAAEDAWGYTPNSGK